MCAILYSKINHKKSLKFEQFKIQDIWTEFFFSVLTLYLTIQNISHFMYTKLNHYNFTSPAY